MLQQAKAVRDRLEGQQQMADKLVRAPEPLNVPGKTNQNVPSDQLKSQQEGPHIDTAGNDAES